MLNKFAAVTTLASLAASSPLARRAPVGPVFPDNFPDPSIIQVGDTWYGFATSGLGAHFPVAKSAANDFNSWSLLTDSNGNVHDAMPNGPGSWSTGANLWAPNIIQVGDTFVMYYTAQSNQDNPKGSKSQCIGVATASSVEGPYTAEANALACPSDIGGAIDPSGFVDSDGSIWVVYKIDGNSIGNGGSCGNGVAPIVPTPIKLQRMDSTGVNTDGSDPIIILDRSDADGPLVEAPSLGKVDDTYFLFFSSGCYADSSYDISYAYSHSGITANGQNYTKQQYPNAPLAVTGTDGLYAPGGLAFAADGQHIAFHADANSSIQAGLRQLYVGEVTVDASAGTVSFS